jgi:hypothetical protein
LTIIFGEAMRLYRLCKNKPRLNLYCTFLYGTFRLDEEYSSSVECNN